MERSARRRRRPNHVSPIAAPARLRQFAGLPRIYTEVGELDIFRRKEDIAYAQAPAKAGVSVKLYVRPGAPHSFDRPAPGSQVTLRAKQDRLRALRSI